MFKKNRYLLNIAICQFLGALINNAPILLLLNNIGNKEYAIWMGFSMLSYLLGECGITRLNIIQPENKNSNLNIRIILSLLVYSILVLINYNSKNGIEILVGVIFLLTNVIWSTLMMSDLTDGKGVKLLLYMFMRAIIFASCLLLFIGSKYGMLISYIILLLITIVLTNKHYKMMKINIGVFKLYNILKGGKYFLIIAFCESIFKFGDNFFSKFLDDESFKYYALIQKLFLIQVSIVGIFVINKIKKIVSVDFKYNSIEYLKLRNECLLVSILMIITNFLLYYIYLNLNSPMLTNNIIYFSMLCFNISLVGVAISTAPLLVLSMNLNVVESVYIHITGLFIFIFILFLLMAFDKIRLMAIAFPFFEIIMGMFAIYYARKYKFNSLN